MIIHILIQKIWPNIQNFDINYSKNSAKEVERKNEAILNHIAPYFYLNKNNDMIEL